MSDIDQETHELQERENCLEEIYPQIATYYDGDTIESIVNNVWNKVVKPSEKYMKCITKKCIEQEVQTYADELR